MSLIAQDLAETLRTIRRPGGFYTSGTAEIFAPRLEVDGVGAVSLPLLPVQAEQLIAVAERAPYGRGEQTLVDTEVRRTWQIGADRVHIHGRNWPHTLEAIVARAAAGLGLSEPVSADLYKLLVYDPSSFFVRHRDTEKAPGMFATLVLVLPSICTGGELMVRHREREVQLELRCPEPSDIAFAAFYADCVHEVRPIATGCRLALIYNLLRKGKGPAPEAPRYDAEQTRITHLLHAWAAEMDSPEGSPPKKLIYPLEHAYTPAELAFDTLKNADAAVAAVLVPAAEQAHCDVHLALVSIEESGSAEYVDFRQRGRRGRWEADDEAEFEVGEVFERDQSVSDWRRPDGSRPEIGALPIRDDELCPPDALSDEEPDEEHFHEATGNEGASFERTYRRAALVLWPSSRMFAVLNQAGLSATVPYLEQLAQRWIESGEDPESPLRRDAHALCGHMIESWPIEPFYPHGNRSDVSRVLTALAQLRDAQRIDQFFADICAGRAYGGGDNEAIVQAAALLPAQRAAELIERIIAKSAAQHSGASADLLARFAADPGAVRALLHPAAATLVAALPGDPERTPQNDPWRRPEPVSAALVVELMSALGRIGAAELAERATDHLLGCPKSFDMDAVLVPAALRLTELAHSSGLAPIQRLGAACVAHLRARIGEPLEPPRDWTRAAVIACRCKDCVELNGFLADPARKLWTFRAAQAKRSHVEASIRHSACDVDCVTEQHGRPYSLVCTKNQATYENRAQQRKNDLKDLARLEAPNDRGRVA
jgi:hypothetical protein